MVSSRHLMITQLPNLLQFCRELRLDQMDAAIKRVEVLARDGIFGPGVIVGVKSNSDDGKGAQYASQLFFLRVDLKTDVITEIPVVVKMQVADDHREFMGTDIQFANEVTTYDNILPKLNAADLGIACRMLFGSATRGENPEQDIIVLEDLRPFGFKVSKTVFIDHQHVSLAMRKLGEYHGLSYKLKKQSPNSLKALVKELILPQYIDGGVFFDAALLRGFKPLMDKQPDGMASRAYKKLSSVTSPELWRLLKKPVEPFAVIIHGDFNVNNLLFGYDDDKLSGVKFIDFATSMYSDPAIDIFFFLYMNTSPETREEYWDEFLRTYWEGLVSVEGDPGFVFEEFLDHLGIRALWGYLPCSFFLPMMLFPEEEKIPPSEFSKVTDEEKRSWGMESGGEKATEATSSIVRHLLDKGYLEKFVEKFDLSP